MVDRRPTIADVARQAGVSKGLVSFVFNERPGVAPKTRDRILAVAQEMGWRPRPSARSLSIDRSYALGLVVRRRPQVLSTDPFFPAFMAGVETVLSGAGQVLVLSLVPDEEAERQTYRTLLADARVDGVFLTDLQRSDPRIALLAEIGLPAVTIGRPEVEQPFPAVTLDDAPGVAETVTHLHGLGHRRIAYVAGDVEMVHGRRRRASFLAEMERLGCPIDLVIHTDFTAAQAMAATTTLLDLPEPPTAIAYASDLMAIAAVGVLHERGLQVPRDVSVAGFDGIDLGRCIYPTLTTVMADPVGWGQEAARVLLQLVSSGAAEDYDLPAARLVVRDSTGAPP